ncbi:MAG: hypothetical protein K2O35_00010 [Clostridia bacterium]|nr:hypothetical protein [Clostridia bacterium]
MKQSESTILKLLNKYDIDALEKSCLSDEYYEAKAIYTKKNEEVKNLIKHDSKLLMLYRGVLDALQHKNVVYADDMFKVAFTLGIKIGQEVFGKKAD